MAQNPVSTPVTVSAVSLPDAPAPQSTTSSSSSQQTQTGQAQSAQPPAVRPQQEAHAAAATQTHSRRDAQLPRGQRGQQVRRRPRRDEAFMVATRNSFDYSAFVFVGITSLLAEGTNAHSQLGKGVAGYWAYYWRGYLDKTDGNYWVDWAMPTVFHQDERYYAMGEGGFWKRTIYCGSTRDFITPNYHGKNSFNASEILGRGISQAISLSYYPSKTQTASGFASKICVCHRPRHIDQCLSRVLARHQRAPDPSASLIVFGHVGCLPDFPVRKHALESSHPTRKFCRRPLSCGIGSADLRAGGECRRCYRRRLWMRRCRKLKLPSRTADKPPSKPRPRPRLPRPISPVPANPPPVRRVLPSHRSSPARSRPNRKKPKSN